MTWRTLFSPQDENDLGAHVRHGGRGDLGSSQQIEKFGRVNE
jgi:hypothetical protein